MWWDAPIPPWPGSSRPWWPGLACAAGRLVTAQTAMVRQRRLPRDRTRRVLRLRRAARRRRWHTCDPLSPSARSSPWAGLAALSPTGRGRDRRRQRRCSASAAGRPACTTVTMVPPSSGALVISTVEAPGGSRSGPSRSSWSRRSRSAAAGSSGDRKHEAAADPLEDGEELAAPAAAAFGRGCWCCTHGRPPGCGRPDAARRVLRSCCDSLRYAGLHQ